MKRMISLALVLAFSLTMVGCAAMEASVDEPLVNTYWKLTRLGEAPVAVVDNQREAHLVLHEEDRRVAGSTGCNRLMGGYRLAGQALSFGQMATTRMACMAGMDTEQAFLAALDRVAAWDVEGKSLTLTDAQGEVVARFEAVHLY
ncbi:META domain-containing protein [Halomonas pacifica]|uniref:DUF306 domain-containing protein n=1 Tax=Bisbaumannia pacifica TaxID=77098 RepID=A0A510X671_9GAMM|nr:META domain-containing protein [Halomonas pacifica]MDC8803171.1 META domain-containing protein [Halomonas pacifica]GEK46933.1 hypothetical protein HPA02_12160 [Halomonas pacifica]